MAAQETVVQGPNQAWLKTAAPVKVKVTPLAVKERVQGPNQARLKAAALVKVETTPWL